MEIVDTGYSGMSTFYSTNRANYAIGNDKQESKGLKDEDPLKNIIFCEELGLAVQRPPNGMSIEQLWKII